MTVTIIMANYCGADYLAAAIESVLRQTHADLELIVSDDASTDASPEIVRAYGDRDSRVRLIEAPSNGGPAAARNRALDAATGDWVAVMDSDDMIHPDRIRRLLAAADRLGADMVADDKLFFGDMPGAGGRTLLGQLSLRAPLETDLGAFLDAGRPGSEMPPLGYLKPLMRRACIGDLRYDESLKNSEDYDFYLRLMLNGARLFLLPDPMYLYRRHSASISFRLSARDLRAMIDSQDRMRETLDDPTLRAQIEARRGELVALLDFQLLVDAIKARDHATALRQLARRPALAADLGRIALARVRRKMTPQDPGRSALALAILSPGEHPTPGDMEPLRAPALPAPGDPWSEAPAAFAGRLSDLSARHDLDVTVSGDDALWSFWLLPRYRSVTFDAASAAGTSGLPLP
ncbi:glycosyltransferase family 2 protein [Albibacillus kandeliae]|uniref:glycosyltransferase family 2 protein n=1 Tax=Albibacillus kandeliae TaxID=2174228 RepID=UPI000D69BE31|nr:glycosyltransferase family 2 protein [Albibacillus kandeliae]